MSTGIGFRSVGILGAGQLGRMLALAGYPLGLRFRLLDTAPDAPAGRLAELVTGSFDDPHALARLASGMDVITYEFENVPVSATAWLSQHAPVYPPARALEVSQDRLVEKTFLNGLGIPTPHFAPVMTRADLDAAVSQIGLPAVLKTRRFGYDGKGQAVLRVAADVASAWDGLSGAPLLLEQFVPFDREMSILAARSRDGSMAFYPLVENEHRDGILRQSIPMSEGECSGALQAQAQDAAARVLQELDYAGVLAIEFFQVGSRLLANEMAPRVHNSGHWTIEGAETSQFENHLRGILGMPLGSTALVGCSAMLNLIGRAPSPELILAVPGAHLHWYGKAPRPGRKLGHVTVRAENLQARSTAIAKLRDLIER